MRWLSYCFVVLLTFGCRDQEQPSFSQKEPKARVIVAPDGFIQPVPPFQISPNGVGHVGIGNTFSEVFMELQIRAHYELIRHEAVVSKMISRGYSGELTFGGANASTVDHVVVYGSQLGKTKEGIQVGKGLKLPVEPTPFEVASARVWPLDQGLYAIGRKKRIEALAVVTPSNSKPCTFDAVDCPKVEALDVAKISRVSNPLLAATLSWAAGKREHLVVSKKVKNQSQMYILSVWDYNWKLKYKRTLYQVATQDAELLLAATFGRGKSLVVHGFWYNTSSRTIAPVETRELLLTR